MSKQYFIVRSLDDKTLLVYEENEAKSMLDFVKSKVSSMGATCSTDKQKMSMIVEGRYSEVFFSDYALPSCSFGINGVVVVYTAIHGTKK